MTTRMRSATSIQQNKIRVLVIGASRVGKTSIIQEFTQKKFIEGFEDSNTEEVATVIVELMDVEVTLISALRRLAIKTAQAYILVYSLDEPKSFDYVTNIKQEIVEMKGEGMPIVVVGNKADTLDQRIHQLSKIAGTAADWDIPFTVMSLRSRVNTESVYRHLFSHRTLQKLVDVVAVINASAISSNIRRASLPAGALQKTLCTSHIVYGTEKEELSSTHVTGDSSLPHESQERHPKSRWSKMIHRFRGLKHRK